MRSKAFYASVTLLLAAGTFVAIAAAPAEKARTTWEYQVVQTASGPPDDLDSLGKEGWELVSATADAKNKYCLYFKREK